MLLFTTCKINLGLNVIERRPDGYHNLSTVMVPVSWGDILEITPAKGNKTTLTTMGRHIDCKPEDNLVMKAYNAVNNLCDIPPVDIYLEKLVPDGAGLGGGSADASFTLTALNDMFELGLTKERLSEIAASLGADCPLFVYNRPMLATGTGTTLSPVELNISSYHILIVKPPVKVSTREAYSGVKPAKWPIALNEMLPDIISAKPCNDFEASVFKVHPRLNDIKQHLYNAGAVYASMSGSGSALFALYASMSQAEEAASTLPGDCITHICHAI